ncbi:glycoside hydrolase family 13 protein [Oceanobacillus sp. M60]|uniref:glycoside hydrolase family 13 protein n=1 Tax=Oceanobacillus TaxID=182709 RepID=UPI002F96E28D
MNKKWWKEATAYQIYPRSFMDSNGDGIGDIQGIISKLDYLKDLGIDVIWVSPVYQSPNDDNGYDISNYQAIAKEFGTMADFDELLEKTHQKGMRLIMDLVINHTSDEHPWFIESRSSKNNPYRDYYIWHPEKKNGEEPNNWESIFGGSAWKYDEQTKEYFMHIFSKKQPDLNWENEAVRNDLYKMVNWWLDKGIDGFRVDAISHIKKKPSFPDMPNPKKKKYVPSFKGHMNQEGIHEFLQEFKKATLDHYDIMTVGEANGVKLSQADDWVGEKHGVFDMIFQFDHLNLWGRETGEGLDLEELKDVFTTWQKGLEKVGWNALFLENHDQPRSVSSWGDPEKYHAASAKAFAVLYFMMQGTPFIYQGQEIGMTNAPFESIEEYDAVDSKNFYKEQLEKGVPKEQILAALAKTSRDHSRTPMQWNNEANGGFTTGAPWMKVNPNYTAINVEEQQDHADSILNFYKRLIALRKQEQGLIYGNYNLMIAEHPDIYAYTRTYQEDKWIILVNVFGKATEYELPEKLKDKNLKLLINNYEEAALGKLKPYQAVIYQVD